MTSFFYVSNNSLEKWNWVFTLTSEKAEVHKNKMCTDWRGFTEVWTCLFRVRWDMVGWFVQKVDRVSVCVAHRVRERPKGRQNSQGGNLCVWRTKKGDILQSRDLRVTQHSEQENHILRFVRSNYIDKETASWTITVVEMWGQQMEGEQGFLFQFYKKKKKKVGETSGRKNG